MQDLPDEPDQYPAVQRIIPALGAAMPKTTAPASVFDLHDKPIKLKRPIGASNMGPRARKNRDDWYDS